MSLLDFYFKIPSEIRRVSLYYFLFCFFFILFQLSLISTFSFFHFLLDHDMNTIENWLNRNSWEIITMAKLTSLFLITKFAKMNNFEEVKFRDYFKVMPLLPSKKVFGLIAFLLIIFYAFIDQFGGGVDQNQFKEDLFYSSFVGSSLFFLADYVLLFILTKNFGIEKYQKTILMVTLVMFLVTSKIALPYINKYFIFLIIHFLTIQLIGMKGKFTDSVYYSVFLIAPMSSIYGLDIVWDNAYSLFSYQTQLPIFGIIGIWGIAVGYYHYSKLD